MNYSEIFKLAIILSENDIPFSFEEHPAHAGGYHLCYPSNNSTPICSVIQTPFSYGGKYGGLEIMGLLTKEEALCDDVVGCLMAEEVAERIIDHWNKD